MQQEHLSCLICLLTLQHAMGRAQLNSVDRDSAWHVMKPQLQQAGFLNFGNTSVLSIVQLRTK